MRKPLTQKRLSTPELIQEYLIKEDRDGRINRPKLAKQMGIGSSMLNMIMNRQRPFPPGRIDETAEFFHMLSEEFIAHARKIIQPRESQQDTGGHNNPPPSVAGGRFHKPA